MQSGEYKASSILVARGGRTRVFRSIDEMPAADRADLLRSLGGEHSGVVLIAEQGSGKLLEEKLKEGLAPLRQSASCDVLTVRLALEIALVGGAGLVVWILATLR
jgi:hypothetical protein